MAIAAIFRKIAAFIAVLLFISCNAIAAEGIAETGRVSDATQVLNSIARASEGGIPAAMFRQAQAIVVIPGMIKLGFLVGGRFGNGVMAVRRMDGTWERRFMVRLSGMSLGWQAGIQSTDVILVFKSRRNIEAVREGSFTLGADAAVAIGPVGRQAEIATDVTLASEIYSYSLSRGLFAGVSFEGAALAADEEATAALYGMPPEQVPAMRVLPGSVDRFLSTIRSLAR
jgi:lipid-binding SYLF domain-containing protein